MNSATNLFDLLPRPSPLGPWAAGEGVFLFAVRFLWTPSPGVEGPIQRKGT